MLAYYFMGDLTTFKMRLFYFFITILFFFGNEVYGQSSVTTDFPKYVDTGNPEKDAQTYAAEKEAWIATHTEAYIAMQPGLSEDGKEVLRKQGISQISQERSKVRCESPKDNNYKIQKIAYEDFILMSDDERAKIEEVPELFQIVKRSEIESK